MGETRDHENLCTQGPRRTVLAVLIALPFVLMDRPVARGAEPEPANTQVSTATVEQPERGEAATVTLAADSPVIMDCDQSSGWLWDEPLVCHGMPGSLLWQPPLANQREPRMAVRITNFDQELTIDSAFGGEFGLFRYGP